jgi:hypothetical protein
MTARYLHSLFSPAVKAAQAAQGSRTAYADRDGAGEGPDRLSETEMAFIAGRDSFYMATVGADGWPYIQHRGGPAGFLRVIDPGSLAFADFRGNRQYISLGNLAGDGRVALFLMDYVRQARLKLLARAEVLEGPAAAALLPQVANPGHRGRIERVILLRIEAFDWNCPQHITQRFTAEDLSPVLGRLQARIAELEGTRQADAKPT